MDFNDTRQCRARCTAIGIHRKSAGRASLACLLVGCEHGQEAAVQGTVSAGPFPQAVSGFRYEGLRTVDCVLR